MTWRSFSLLVCLLGRPISCATVNITLHDTDRNRGVTSTICFGDLASSPALEQLDLLVFAHGGGLYAADYEYLCSDPHPKYAIARLGSNASDNAMDLQLMADDVTFLAKALPLQSKSVTSSSLFQRLNGRVVLAGHSMGAAAVLLAGSVSIDGVVAVGALAPGFWGADQAGLLFKLGSETSALCERPLLIVEGDQDCANSLDLQGLPVWSNVTASCNRLAAPSTRALALVKGATHCQWPSPVEGSCPFDVPCPAPRLDRSRQQALGKSLLHSLSLGRMHESLRMMKSKGQLSFVDEQSSQSDLSKLHSYCPCSNESEIVVLV